MYVAFITLTIVLKILQTHKIYQATEELNKIAFVFTKYRCWLFLTVFSQTIESVHIFIKLKKNAIRALIIICHWRQFYSLLQNLLLWLLPF